MSYRPDWSEWILQKNNEAKQEELKKSDGVRSWLEPYIQQNIPIVLQASKNPDHFRQMIRSGDEDHMRALNRLLQQNPRFSDFLNDPSNMHEIFTNPQMPTDNLLSDPQNMHNAAVHPSKEVQIAAARHPEFAKYAHNYIKQNGVDAGLNHPNIAVRNIAARQDVNPVDRSTLDAAVDTPIRQRSKKFN